MKKLCFAVIFYKILYYVVCILNDCNLQIFEERRSFRQTSLDIKAHHTTGTAGLSFHQFILRMRGQPGVEHLLHAWVGLQKSPDNQAAPLVFAHTNVKRFQAAADQETVKRRRDRTDGHLEIF